MTNNNRCGCGCRHSNKSLGCLESVRGCRRWENFPYYDGCCPDADGCYDCGCGHGGGGLRGADRAFGIFSACQPLAVAANGCVPLAKTSGCDGEFDVRGGAISMREQGVYLATMTVRVPAATGVASTFALNVNGVEQPTTITPVETAADGAQVFAATSQAIFDAGAGDAVTIRSADTVNVTEPSIQPMFTLTLMRLDG